MKQMEPTASLSGNLAICPLEGHKTTLCCSGRDLMVCPEGFLFNRGKLWVKELSMKT